MCCCLGNKKCMCWFIAAAVFAVIVIGCCVGTFIQFGGPVPTYTFERGSVVLFFANSCTLVFSVVAIVFTLCGIKNIYLYIILMIFMLGTNFCSWYTVYAFRSLTPNVEDVQKYTSDYSNEHNGAPPPFLDYIQMNVPICCGAEGFHDYVPNPPVNEDDTFDVPDSCCLRPMKTKPKRGCGKGLTQANYRDSLWFHEQIGDAMRDVQKAKSVKQATDILEKRFMELVQNKTELVKEKMNEQIAAAAKIPSDLTSRNVLDSVDEYIPAFVRDKFNESKGNMDTFNDLIANLDMTSVLPINVYGCARIVSDLGKAEMVPAKIRGVFRGLFTAILVFIIFQAIINFIGLVYLNLYYWKKVDAPVPLRQPTPSATTKLTKDEQSIHTQHTAEHVQGV